MLFLSGFNQNTLNDVSETSQNQISWRAFQRFTNPRGRTDEQGETNGTSFATLVANAPESDAEEYFNVYYT